MQRAVPLLALILSACAGMDATGCRAANWYDVGFRDAIYAMQPQDYAYASQCEPHGVKIDMAAYAQGWREGKWEADDRRDESGD